MYFGRDPRKDRGRQAASEGAGGRKAYIAVVETKNDFSKGSISQNILALALPMTAAQLVNVLYSVVDRIYLGRLPGSSHLALTGLGVTIPIVSIIMGFANLCGTGGAPLCSICRGRGDNQEAEKVMGNAFTLLVVLGLAVTAFFLALKRPILYSSSARARARRCCAPSRSSCPPASSRESSLTASTRPRWIEVSGTWRTRLTLPPSCPRAEAKIPLVNT